MLYYREIDDIHVECRSQSIFDYFGNHNIVLLNLAHNMLTDNNR